MSRNGRYQTPGGGLGIYYLYSTTTYVGKTNRRSYQLKVEITTTKYYTNSKYGSMYLQKRILRTSQCSTNHLGECNCGLLFFLIPVV